MTRYGIRKGGWFGNSHGHAMAARGITLYAKKTKMDPLFYANKSEKDIPFAVVMDHVRKGQNYNTVKSQHPDADPEEIRIRGIKALETMDGSNTLSTINKNGVDETLQLAKNDKKFAEQVEVTLADDQRSSFIHPLKISAIKEGIRSIK